MFIYFLSFWSAFLAIFQTSDGTIIGKCYKSNTGWTAIYGSILSGDYIFATFKCSPIYLVIYSISADSFTFKSFYGSALYSLATESGSGR